MADGLRHYLNPAEMHSLGRLVLQSRYAVDGNLAGAHRSPHRGSSSEFADHRQYIAGDDPKRLDWKVLARTDRYYIRRYEDETNLRVYVVIDRSASMKYTSRDETKFHYACRMAGALGYVTLKARDSVGLCLYSDKIDLRMDARNSFAHLNNMMRALQQVEPAAVTETARTLHQLADSIRKRALIVLLSDLLDDEDRILRALAHFRKQHHDVIVFQVLDPAEIDLSFERSTIFEDLETNERMPCDPKAIATAYRETFGAFLDRYRKGCREMQIDYRLIRTDRPLDTFVRAYLGERRRSARSM